MKEVKFKSRAGDKAYLDVTEIHIIKGAQFAGRGAIGTKDEMDSNKRFMTVRYALASDAEGANVVCRGEHTMEYDPDTTASILQHADDSVSAVIGAVEKAEQPG